MKVKKLRAALRATSSMIERAGDEEGALRLQRLELILSGWDDKDVSAFVLYVAALQYAAGRRRTEAVVTLHELRANLADLANTVEAVSNKKTADSIRDLAAAMRGRPELSADEALHDLEDLLATGKAETRDGYISRLRGAGAERTQFDPVLSEIEKDKMMTKNDLDMIAHAYTNGREKWPNRKSALKAIETDFVQRVYEVAKMKIVEKAKVW
jgi:hypothetical protein